MTDVVPGTSIDAASRKSRTPEDIEDLIERYFSEFELPSPEALAQYEKISPGAAQKILELRVLREQHAKNLVELSETHRRLAVLTAYFAIIFVGVTVSLLSFISYSANWVQILLSVVPAVVGVLSAVAFRANRARNV